jgi:hypothetical protein
VYLSSPSHYGGRPSVDRVDWLGRRAGSYADSKLFVTTLAAPVARLHPDTLSNARRSGMGFDQDGWPGAPDDRS